MGMKIPNFSRMIKSFIKDTIRLLRLLKKPKSEEYWIVAKITALGIVILGIIGYVVQTIKVFM